VRSIVTRSAVKTSEPKLLLYIIPKSTLETPVRIVSSLLMRLADGAPLRCLVLQVFAVNKSILAITHIVFLVISIELFALLSCIQSQAFQRVLSQLRT
jgi:hypothetical protein